LNIVIMKKYPIQCVCYLSIACVN